MHRKLGVWLVSFGVYLKVKSQLLFLLQIILKYESTFYFNPNDHYLIFIIKNLTECQGCHFKYGF